MAKLNKDSKQKLKEELESMLDLDNESSENSINTQDNQQLNTVIGQIADDNKVDFVEVRNNLKKESKKLFDSLFKFYIDNDIINEEEAQYLKLKKELDVDALANFNYQIDTIQRCVDVAMNEILISPHPRMLEVVGQLQGQLGNVLKLRHNYLLFNEESYKKMKYELLQKKNEELDTPKNNNVSNVIEQDTSVQYKKEDTTGQHYIGVGTRNLMKQITEEIPLEKIQELNKDKDSYNLTNPGNKRDLMKTLNVTDDMIKTNRDEKQSEDELNSDDINNLI